MHNSWRHVSGVAECAGGWHAGTSTWQRVGAPSRRCRVVRSCTVASCCCGLVPSRRTVAVLRRRVVTLSALSGGWHWRARLVHRVVVSASDAPAVALSRGRGCTAQRLCARGRRRGGSGNRRARGVVTCRRDRRRDLVV